METRDKWQGQDRFLRTWEWFINSFVGFCFVLFFLTEVKIHTLDQPFYYYYHYLFFVFLSFSV